MSFENTEDGESRSDVGILVYLGVEGYNAARH